MNYLKATELPKKLQRAQLLYSDGLRWAGLDAGRALGALLFVYYWHLVVTHSYGFFRALLDAGSTAYALLFVNRCWHY